MATGKNTARNCKREISPEDQIAVIALRIIEESDEENDVAQKYRARTGALALKLWDSPIMDLVYQKVFAAVAKGRKDSVANCALNEFTAAIIVAAKQCR
jgi:hypothetical protein